jgi:rare lipoprotein A
LIPRLALVAAVAALAGCTPHGHHPAPQIASAGVHYVVGQPYQAAGLWRYPHESFEYDETGLAALATRNSGRTTDGEVADAGAMAAAHPTLQLPAIATITNLDTGLQVQVRINDRGPAARGRLVALTPRAFRLLGGGTGQTPLRVRVQVEESDSRRLAADLGGGDQPNLPVATAPAAPVAAEPLPPPPGARAAGQLRVAPAAPRAPMVAFAATLAVPLRLPEQVTRVAPHPGALYVEAGAFGQLQYAELMQARLAALGAQTSTNYDAPRERAYRVRIGPYVTAAAADAMLDRAIHAGANEPRIVAE